MAQSDRRVLKAISLNQAETARLLRTSRQAVNAGIQSENEYFDTNRLILIHRALVPTQDPRADLVAKVLKDLGAETNEISLNILGIVLEDEDAKLISNNEILRDFLRREISEMISFGCAKFRTGLEEQKKIRDELRVRQLEHLIRIGAMSM